MTNTAFSFCFSPVKSSHYDSSQDDQTITDIQLVCNNAMNQDRSCHITVASTAVPAASAAHFVETDYTVTLYGPEDNLLSVRQSLLQQCPLHVRLVLNMPLSSLPAAFCNHPHALLEKLKADTHVSLALNLPSSIHPDAAIEPYFESEQLVAVAFTGLPDQVEWARIRFLVALDELANLHADTLSIPKKLHYLLCGRKRATLQPIIADTLVNLYLPSPFVSSQDTDEDPSADPIYITGRQAADVARVKETLTKLASQKAKSMFQKVATMDPRKLDWMQLHRRDELAQVMHDNGSFITLPPVGSNINTVTVFAENRVNAERTLRSINFLACSVYEACFFMQDYGGDSTIWTQLTTSLSQLSGAEVAFHLDTSCLQVFGTELAVRHIYQQLGELPFFKMYHKQTIFKVELSNEQREFISGKKNGKINKIMKTSGAKIKFLPYSEYNFILEVESTSFIKALDGLTLLQKELPAEISFYVPETYHKRIIGVGGKNIQRIMKKYGVYVKFSNAEEFASLGGYYGNEDNVVARTPMKNQVNLDNLRHAVMDLITPKDKDFVIQTLAIPFRQHRILLSEYKTYLQEITKKTGVKVIWPNHELAQDLVTLVGPQSNLDHAAQLINHILADVYYVPVPFSSQLVAAIDPATSNFDEKVVMPLKQESEIVVDVSSIFGDQAHVDIKNAPTISDALVSAADHEPCTIALRLPKAKLQHLQGALNTLVQHLHQHQVPMYKEMDLRVIHTNNAATASATSQTASKPNSNNTSTSTVGGNLGNVVPPLAQKPLPMHFAASTMPPSTAAPSFMAATGTNHFHHPFESALLSKMIPPGKKKKNRKLEELNADPD
ncbi:hypothetical protein BC940DRAFT_147834 [Gongronella butleri]|nr:hypothetical protein BC940DRAFT_147834 [Gongronella butleri]